MTLTAHASFAGGEEVTKDFVVHVPAAGVSDEITDCGLEHVTLTDDYLTHAADKENEYLLSLSSKKFLHEFYKVAGLTPQTTEGYGGWEKSTGNNFRGHTFGHYMTALSQAYRGTADETTKGKLLVQLKDAVNGLKECQDAYAVKYPNSAGYISAFPEGELKKVDGVESPTNKGSDNLIVPYYNLHKVLAGLTDVYKNLSVSGDEEAQALADQAFEIVKKFGTYFYRRLSKLTDKKKMLSVEYGGMNDALYELYRLTGDANYKTAAEYFDETDLFDNLEANKDVLSGKHANTTIPKLTGALKRYTVLTENGADMTEEEKNELAGYRKAAENFWDIVVNHHTYVTGGNSRGEHFHDADKLYADAVVSDYDGALTCETCNTYNMLKLSRELYKLTKDKKYMDYYENTYINAILSSQNPETGTTMYFQPMAPGYNKIFNRPEDEFWCCTGTGMENFSKLGDTMYFTEGTDVYVNMYFGSTFVYERQNLSLAMQADMPDSDEVTITVTGKDGAEVADNTSLRLRIPDWVVGNPSLTVNGTAQQITQENGYAVVKNVKANDVIKWKLPMEVKAYATQDNRNFVAFKYGPVVLSAALGMDNIDAYNNNGVSVRVGTKDNTCQTAISVEGTTVSGWLAHVTENVVRVNDADGRLQYFELKNTDSPKLKYTPHYKRYKERYGLYMTLEEQDSEASQERIAARKRLLRDQEMTVDSLTSFDQNNSEFAKNLKWSDTSVVGSFNGRTYREANNGWFSYDFAINPKAEKNYLTCTWYSGDAGRKFELLVNDEKIQDIVISKDAGERVFYDQRIEIPAKYWNAENLKYKKDAEGNDIKDEEGNKIPIVTVKFQGSGLVGGLYGIKTSDTIEYDTVADLTALSFDKGTLSPAFSGSVKSYTLTVPAGTTEVQMTAKGQKDSSILSVGNIVFDETRPRTIALSALPQAITLKATAQDHETAAEYAVNVREEGMESCMVRLDANGGTVSPFAIAYSKGSKLGTLPVPTRPRYIFLGWYTQQTGGQQADANMDVTADTMFYARWEEAEIVVGASGSQTDKDTDAGKYLIAMIGSGDANGSANAAAYEKGVTADGGTGLGSTRVGCIAFKISDAWKAMNPEKVKATLTIYVPGVNGNLGNGKTKAGVFAVEKPLSEITMTDAATYPAKGNDYSKGATVFSNEWISKSSLGWKTFDVSEMVKTALAGGSDHVIFRLQTVMAGFHIMYEGENMPMLSVEQENPTEEEKEAAAKKEASEALAEYISTKKPEGTEASYTAESWEAYQTALTAAQNILKDASATSVQIKKAQEALETAQKSLVKKPGGSEEPRKVKVTSIKFAEKSYQIAAGKKINLKKVTTVLPKNADNKQVTYTIAKKYAKYASVKKGVVTTKKAGKGKTVVVTAKAADGSGIKKNIKIKIMKNAVTKLSVKKKTLSVKAGKSVKLNVKVNTNGKNANKKLAYISSKTKYATVSSKGVVKAKKAGKGKTVTITVKTTDGTNKSLKIKVKVKK